MERDEDPDARAAESAKIMRAFRSRQWDPEPDRAPWLLAVAVVSVVLGLAWINLRPADKMPEPLAVSEPVKEVAPVNEPLPLRTMRPDQTVRSAPRAARQVGQAGIYECRQNGQRVLSDRPCGPDAVERVIDTGGLNTFTEVAPPPVVVTPAPRQVTPTGTAPPVRPQAVQPSNAQQCEAIQAWIDQINARMRQGYTSQQGEWLRAEWHRAKKAYSDAKCGR